MTTKDVLDLIGHGKPLCISISHNFAMCMTNAHWMQGTKEDLAIEIDFQLAKQTIDENKNILCVTEQEDVRQKSGWKSSNLPGHAYQIWRFIQ